MLVELGEQGSATKEKRREMLQMFQQQVARWRDKESMYLQPLYFEAASDLDDATRTAAESVGDQPPPEDTTAAWGTPQELVGDDELEDESEEEADVGEKRKRGIDSMPANLLYSSAYLTQARRSSIPRLPLATPLSSTRVRRTQPLPIDLRH